MTRTSLVLGSVMLLAVAGCQSPKSYAGHADTVRTVGRAESPEDTVVITEKDLATSRVPTLSLRTEDIAKPAQIISLPVIATAAPVADSSHAKGQCPNTAPAPSASRRAGA